MPGVWNITLDDSSPVFSYFPYGDGAAGDGWATYYSTSGFRQAGGNTPLGNSSHVTWNNNSSISLSFYGISVYLYGQANCTYDVLLDDVHYAQLPYDDVLASFPNIAPGQHNIIIIPYANNSESAFSFDKAIITLGSISSDPGQGDVYNSRNSSIAYQGSWTQFTSNSTPSAAAPAFYRETKVGGSTASLKFKGEAVAIKGALGWEHGLYRVTLDGVSSIYNASSWWTIGETVLYFQGGLDPTKPHSVSLTNEGHSSGGLSTLDLNSITVFGSNPNPNLIANIADDPGTSNSLHSVPTLTIAITATVGSILSIIIVCVLVYLYLRRARGRGDRDGYDRITWGPKGSGDGKKVGYIPEPFVLPPDSPISVTQPPIGHSIRSTKGWLMEEPNATQIGYSYWPDQKEPASPSFHSKSDASGPSVVSGVTGSQQDELPSATLGHGLLGDHVMARLHLPMSGGGQSLYEYVPPNPRDR